MYVGVDQVEVKKIKGTFLRSKDALSRIFTSSEISYCWKKKNRFQHLAARFAAKEATFKALGIGWIGKVRWTDVEVLNNSLGQPKLKLHGIVRNLLKKKGILKAEVSISHNEEYAIAVVLLISNNFKI